MLKLIVEPDSTGLESSRPAASAVSPGFVFQDSTTSQTTISDGVKWYATTGRSAGDLLNLSRTTPTVQPAPIYFNAYDGTLQVVLGATNVATSYLRLKGGASGIGPSIAVESTTETNTPLTVAAKGTGSTYVGNGKGTQFLIGDEGSGNAIVNYVKVTGGSTGNGASLTTDGETNVSLLLTGKGTGGVDCTSATFLQVPKSAGLAPIVGGRFGYDSTQKTWRFGMDGSDNASKIALRGIGNVSVQVSGTTNNSSSGSGSFFDHSLTQSIAANLINVIGKRLVIRTMWKLITGATAPNLDFAIKFGSTNMFGTTSAVTPINGLTNGETFLLEFEAITITTGATGTVAMANVIGMRAIPNGTTDINVAVQPVTLDLTSAQTITYSTRWSAAGTGTNTIQLLAASVDLVN